MGEVQRAPMGGETTGVGQAETPRRDARAPASRLEGKVAQLLNERQIVINIGRLDGVEAGMRFAVLAGKPIEVLDPDTGRSLGTLDQDKVRVESTQVLDQMTVCTTYETKFVGSIVFFDLAQTFAPGRIIPKTLRATAAAYPAPLSPEDSYVKNGDRVRQHLDPA